MRPPILRFLHSPTGRGLRAICSVAVLGAFVLWIDWPALRRLDVAPRPGLLAGATLLALAAYPLLAWRWLLLYRAQGVALPFRWAHRVTWIGQFYNSFLPSGLGGDAVRALHLFAAAPGLKAQGVLSLALDRAFGLGGLCVLAALALLPQLPAISAQPTLRLLFWTCLTASLVLVVIALLLWRPRSAPAPTTSSGTAAGLLAAVRAAPGAHAAAAGLTAVIWGLDFAAIWLCAHAIGLPLPWWETCVAAAVAYAASALPISLGGHGVREGALVSTLALFGLLHESAAAKDQALLLGLLVWALTLLASVVGGIVQLLAAPRMESPPAALAPET